MSLPTARERFAELFWTESLIAEVADFCHVKPQTIMAWSEEQWPRGGPMYLFWAFLEFKGLGPAELEALPGPSRQLLLIVGAGLQSFEDVQLALDYQNLQDVYKLFRAGGSSPTKERAWKLQQLVRRFLPELESYRAGVKPVPSIPKDYQPVVQEVSAPVVPRVQEVPITPVVATNPAVESSDVSSLVRLMRLVMKRSESLSPEELRAHLRDVPKDELERFALLLLELV
jgi:uncharacterized protein YfkK (UPF0435 family)